MRLLALLAALLWSGLAMAQPVKSLQFFDAPVFDQQLSDSLASRGQWATRPSRPEPADSSTTRRGYDADCGMALRSVLFDR